MRAPKPVMLVALLACSSGSPSSTHGASVSTDGPCVTAGGTTTLVPQYAYALAFDDANLYAATGAGILAMSLGGGAVTPITSAAEVDALAVANGNAYFISSHAVGGPDAQGKTSSTTALYEMALPNGTPQILLDGAFAMQVGSDGTWLWWSGVGLSAMKLPGGTPVAFPLPAATTVNAFVVGQDALYLAAQTLRPDYSNFGSILRAAKDGSSVTSVLGDLADAPYALAVDDASVYWIDQNGVQGAGLDGSRVRTLATVSARSVALDAHAVYFTTNLGSTTDTVEKVATSGGAPATVASGLKSPGTLAVHGGNVYWVDGTSVALSDPNPGYALMTACK